MATLPLIPNQIETLVQYATISMLGLPAPTIVEPPEQDPSLFAVRIGWQEQGQPNQEIDDNVTYVRSREVDDQYNRVRDVSYEQSTDAEGNTVLTKVTNYTRVWEIMWTVCGPNSFDNARLLRTRLFDQDIHDQFANSKLWLVTDPAAPRRVPEYVNGQWWPRVDFEARFNEFVTERQSETFITNAEFVLQNQRGEVLVDAVVDKSGYGVGPYGGEGYGA